MHAPGWRGGTFAGSELTANALANPGTPENWKAVEPPSALRQNINPYA